jgi:NDP-sugar pyrophosphorylase family protein
MAGKLSSGITAGVERHRLASDVVLDPTVNIVDPCVIGRGSRLEAGCRVGPAAVVGEHCVVGRGAQVAGAVLWDRVSVADGAMLSDCIVASGARVGAGAVIGPGVVLEPNRVVPDRARLTA